MPRMVSEIAVGTALTLLLSVAGIGAKLVYDQLTGRITKLEDELEGLEAETEREREALASDHAETRRMAEAAYAGVYGDERRPNDEGLLEASQQAREEIRDDQSDLARELEALRQEVSGLRERVDGSEDSDQQRRQLDDFEDD